jgi:hypothetical protein
MPTTQMTLDLGFILMLGKYLIAGGLIVFGLFTFVIPMLFDIGNRVRESPPTVPVKATTVLKPKRKDVDRSSDTPPPTGFAEHLRIIEATAPNAEPKIWWEYAKAEMTEAEVAIAEARLARIADPAVINGSLGGEG